MHLVIHDRVPVWRWFLLVAMGAVFFASKDFASQTEFRMAITDAKGLAIPIYARDRPDAVAVVRISRFSHDFQRRGFFRIGVLPMLVADGLTVELRDSRSVADAMRGAKAVFDPLLRKGMVELRQVEFVFPPECRQRLEARRVRFGPQGQWELLDGVILQVSTNRWHASTAHLQVTGEKAGQLTISTPDKTASFNLLVQHAATESIQPAREELKP